MRSKVMVALHEIFNQNLPVERAFPLFFDHYRHGIHAPPAKIAIEFRVLINQGGGVSREVEKDKAVPRLTAEGFQPHGIAIEAFGLVHFRTTFEPSVEFETPVVVGTQKNPRVSTSGLPFGGVGRTVPIIAKSRRHDVHRTMWTDPRENANFPVLSVHDDDRFAEHIEVDEVAGLRNLGFMGKANPIGCEDIFYLPVEQLGAGVGCSGESPTAFERQGCRLFNIAENVIQPEIVMRRAVVELCCNQGTLPSAGRGFVFDRGV